MERINLMKDYCNGNAEEEVAWCGFYGEMECISEGNCGYRSKRILQELAEEFQKNCRLLEMLGGKC